MKQQQQLMLDVVSARRLIAHASHPNSKYSNSGGTSNASFCALNSDSIVSAVVWQNMQIGQLVLGGGLEKEQNDIQSSSIE